MALRGTSVTDSVRSLCFIRAVLHRKIAWVCAGYIIDFCMNMARALIDQ